MADVERAFAGGASGARFTAPCLRDHADDHVRGRDDLRVGAFGPVAFQSPQREFDLVLLGSDLFALPSQ